MSDTNYEAMTEAELEAENHRLGAQKDAIREEQRKIKAALDRKIIERRRAEVLAAAGLGEAVDAVVTPEALELKADLSAPGAEVN